MTPAWFFAPLLAIAASGCAAQQPDARSCRTTEAFAYDRAGALQLRDSQIAVLDGVQLHRITFASPGRQGRSLVTGFLFRPIRSVPPDGWPGVIVMHGFPANARSMNPVSGNIASHGAVVIAIDAPFARRDGPPLTFTERDSVEQVQLIVDLRRAFDVLAAMPDVDTTRLAYVGLSYGGAMGGLLAGVEKRPKTYVLVVADGGFIAHFEALRPGAFTSLPEAQRTRWLAAMQPIEPIGLIHCARSRLLFHSGRRDHLVPPREAERLHAAAPEPKTIRWYDSDHNLDLTSFIDQLAWLHDVVGTDAARPRDQLWCAHKRCPEP